MASAAACARVGISAPLSIVGGYVDVICLIRYSTFVATMTGNLVMTGCTFYELLGNTIWDDTRRSVPGHEHLSASDALYLISFRVAVMFFNCLGAFSYGEMHRRFPHATVSTAAPVIALFALVPDLVSKLVSGSMHEAASMWSVCFLAFSLGCTHFLCSPAAEGSRLKGVTMAATGHMHGVSKLLYKRCRGGTLSPAERDKFAQSMTITLCMAFGAVLGAAALHWNPLGSVTPDGQVMDDWLLVPVSICLFVALTAHDLVVEPPAGWPAAASGSEGLHALREPLAPDSGAGGEGAATRV